MRLLEDLAPREFPVPSCTCQIPFAFRASARVPFVALDIVVTVATSFILHVLEAVLRLTELFAHVLFLLLLLFFFLSVLRLFLFSRFGGHVGFLLGRQVLGCVLCFLLLLLLRVLGFRSGFFLLAYALRIALSTGIRSQVHVDGDHLLFLGRMGFLEPIEEEEDGQQGMKEDRPEEGPLPVLFMIVLLFHQSSGDVARAICHSFSLAMLRIRTILPVGTFWSTWNLMALSSCRLLISSTRIDSISSGLTSRSLT